MSSIKSKLFKYVSLSVMGMIGVSLYILGDTFFIAKKLGSNGLASLNFSLSVFSLVQGIGLMISIGAATKYSLNRKENNKIKSDKSFTQALKLGSIFAIVFILIGLFFLKPLSLLLGANGEVLNMTMSYLRVILLFSPFFILNFIVIAFIRNDNNPRLAMIAMLVSSVLNVLLDYVFMFPLDIGIAGAGLATGLSPVISLLLLSLHLKRNDHNLRLVKSKLKISKIKNIISYGFSSFVVEASSAISLFSFNIVIFNIKGNTGVAAYGIVANIALIAMAIFVGVAQGLQPLASDEYGKNNLENTEAILKYALLITLTLSLIIYSVIYIYVNPIVGAFNSEQNDQVGKLATSGMTIYFTGFLFAGFNIVASAFLSAISKAKQAMTLSILRSLFVLVPMLLVLSHLFEMNGVWLSFVITEIMVIIVTIILLIRKKKILNESLKIAYN